MEQAGWIHILDQVSSYPYIGHLHFGNKKDLPLANREEELQAIQEYLSKNQSKYRQFLRQKGRHPSLDIYACFQPFNEAFRALYPFVDYIRATLRPGDCVLNLWDRSGWTAAMLGGWFPDQQIITVWEGDQDILGYKGFNYWMSNERRHRHRVLFADFQRPLPIESQSVAAVIGMDLLHRFHQPELLVELLRITKPKAPIVFPHVHLTNSEPDPFFERGCRQLHGKDYAHVFSQLSRTTGRSGFIVSEPGLFSWNNQSREKIKPLISNPDHKDYNGCVAWLAQDREPYLKPWRGYEQDWGNMYLLQNPLLAIDTVDGTLRFNTGLYGTLISELMERHQVYYQRIRESIGQIIERDLQEVLYWAFHGNNLHAICQQVQISKERMQELLEKALNLELAQAVPVDEAGFRLQTLLGHQHYILERKEQNLKTFWEHAVAFFPDLPWVKMQDEVLSFAQADELIGLVRQALQHEGLQKGDKILICGDLHPESLLVFWAATSLGLVVVPLSSREAVQRIHDYVRKIEPCLAFVDPGLFAAMQTHGTCKAIMIDQVEDPNYQKEHSLEYWLSQCYGHSYDHAMHPEPEDIAVILWTTGSTDNPKGIPLTHAQLIRSGRIMTETYLWTKTDRYLALGGLETMSGLRHATVAVAESGACCVVPGKAHDIYHQLELITTEKITILAANPLYFRQLLLLLGTRRQASLELGSLRLALSTGNQLPSALRTQWKHQTGILLQNYYGLTETTGICIAELPGAEPAGDHSIGVPIDCMIRIIDEQGHEVPLGNKGELCIRGSGVFRGYYGNEQATQQSLRNGWFHTKDIVVQHTDGSLSLCGRLSDIVKLHSGERVELAAIEEAINQMSELAESTVCSVCTNDRESIAIFFVPAMKGSPQDLIQGIKDQITRSIGSYAVPSLIAVVDEIPRGNHNKPLKKQLLDTYFQLDN
jgi:acyl-coenzyme A synthetase/AMP-(fatty) acid ligase